MQKLPDISQHFSNGIEVRDNEPVEGAIKKFKREVANSGILTELKKREYFEKPSVIKKRERDFVVPTRIAFDNLRPRYPDQRIRLERFSDALALLRRSET